MSSGPTVVLITGASRGLGQLMARRLAERGCLVFGTSRRPTAVTGDGLRLLPLDVRDDESVQRCVASVLAQVGQLDVLINNAGLGLTAALEETSLAEARALFETNFFGVLRMNQAVLPTMRQQQRGRIITIGSAVSLGPVPFMGLYAATKAALASYSDALRHEVAPFNIGVTLVLPGVHRTDFKQHELRPADRLTAYDRLRQGFENVRRRVPRADPDAVARQVVEIVAASSPPARRYVGGDARAAALAQRLLPIAAADRLIRRTIRWHLPSD